MRLGNIEKVTYWVGLDGERRCNDPNISRLFQHIFLPHCRNIHIPCPPAKLLLRPEFDVVRPHILNSFFPCSYPPPYSTSKTLANRETKSRHGKSKPTQPSAFVEEEHFCDCVRKSRISFKSVKIDLMNLRVRS